MSIIYKKRSGDRKAFVQEVFKKFGVQKNATGKRILIKPNVVSYESYPTTTHPEMIEACLELLRNIGERITVADGPAFDAGDPNSLIETHPIKQSCDKYSVTFSDLIGNKTRKVKTRSYELEVSQLAFEHDYIISLPVLKSHGLGLTGALKNHVGFLSSVEKRRSHQVRDMSLVFVELHQVFRPQLYIVDAIETLIKTNEIRHGGQLSKLGYLLAGTDPVSLDIAGLELLKEVEPKLNGVQSADIPQLKYAIRLGIGEAQFEIIE